MKAKGFTLIEMLGVVIILAIIATLVTPIVTKIIKNAETATYNGQIENIRQGAKDWAGEHIFDLPDVGEEELVLNMNDDLIKNGYVSKDIVNPKTGKPFNNIEVHILNVDGRLLYDIYENGILLDEDDNRIN